MVAAWRHDGEANAEKADRRYLRRKKPPPFFIGTVDFEGRAWHCISLPWGLRNKPHTSKLATLKAFSHLPVERRLPELIRIHFAEPLVALHLGDALLARRHHRVEKIAWPRALISHRHLRNLVRPIATL